MSERMEGKKGRRAFLAGASVVAAGSLLPSTAAEAMPSRYARSLSLLAEGDARLDWVLSLLPVTGPPPELAVRGLYRFPALEPEFDGKDVMSVLVYIPRGAYAIRISAFHVAIEDVVFAKASFGGDENPEHNLVMSGRVIRIDDEAMSPFGDLVGRAFAMSCGFEWADERHSAAVFKLLAGSAAGSHVTVLPEAEGSIEISRPLDAY